MADEVERAILAAYGSQRNDENARREALAWLHEFSSRSEAWSICLQLLNSSSKEVQFFASNMLYNKVQREWVGQVDKLKEDVLTGVGMAIRTYVRDESCSLWDKVLQRLCLTLARIAVQTAATLDVCMNEAWTMLLVGLGEDTATFAGTASAAPGNTADARDPKRLTATLQGRALFVSTELLLVLPEENEANASPSHSLVEGLDPQGVDQRLRDAGKTVYTMNAN